MTDEQITRLISRRDKLTNRRDALTDSKRIAAIDRQLEQVEPGRNNAVDLRLGRTCAKLPDYGPQPAPADYRIANRPDNPNWHGVAAWFDDAAHVSVAQAEQQRMIDETASAAECSVIEYTDYQEASCNG